MKKALLVVLSFALFACSLIDKPSSKVELFLNNYNNLSEEVLLDIEKSALNENLNESVREVYKNVLSKQFENMKYEIKDESVDGNSAIVTVNVNVYDLHKIEKESYDYMKSNLSEFSDNDGVFSNDLFNTYRVNRLIGAEDRIDYEIKFYLDKKDDEWVLRTPDKTVLEKINGLYNYDQD